LPNSFFEANFPHCKKNLCVISFDKTNQSALCDYAEPLFFSFDDIVKDKGYFLKEPKTFDTFIFHDDKLFCIEFKNSRPTKIDNREVQDKAIEGLLSLQMILCKNEVNIKDYKRFYFVIFKPANNRDYISQRTGIRFGLDKYKDKFFDGICTIECGDEFLSKLQQIGINLQ